MWGGVNGGEVIGEVCLKRFLILFCFVITAQKILERTDLMVLDTFFIFIQKIRILLKIIVK
jgi:hypothetical protein